jgi:hypothetical protein
MHKAAWLHSVYKWFELPVLATISLYTHMNPCCLHRLSATQLPTYLHGLQQQLRVPWHGWLVDGGCAAAQHLTLQAEGGREGD